MLTSPLNRRVILLCSLLLGVAIPWSLRADEKKSSAPAPAPTAKHMKLLKVFVSEFIKITPGQGKFPKSFERGSVNGPKSEQSARTITFSSNFSIAKYEVPQNLYEAVMGHNPSKWKGPRNSVEMMTWKESRDFCKRATSLLKTAELIEGNEEIRLPTEAEWEYCCRAGTTTAYSFGDKATRKGDKDKQASILDEYGWHTGNAAGNDPPVGAKKPNSWGLYDVHGYLWEFVLDGWRDNFDGASQDGSSFNIGGKNSKRVIRGGSWRDRYELLRSTSRQAVVYDFKNDAVGFRCVRVRMGK